MIIRCLIWAIIFFNNFRFFVVNTCSHSICIPTYIESSRIREKFQNEISELEKSEIRLKDKLTELKVSQSETFNGFSLILGIYDHLWMLRFHKLNIVIRTSNQYYIWGAFFTEGCNQSFFNSYTFRSSSTVTIGYTTGPTSAAQSSIENSPHRRYQW